MEEIHRNIGVALIYCPRENITMEDSISWIRAGGFTDNMYVSKKYRRGIVGNYVHACKYLLRKTNYEWLLILENDVQLCKNTSSILQRFINENDHENTGFISLYTPKKMDKDIRKKSVGWHDIRMGARNIAGQALCFRRSTLMRMLADKKEIKFLAKCSKKRGGAGGGIDSFAGDMMARKGMSTYYHYPSLAEHVGYISARKHVPPGRHLHVGLGYTYDFTYT